MALYIKAPHAAGMRGFDVGSKCYLQLFFFMKSIISLI